MNLKEEQHKIICQAFNNLKSKENLLALLNYVKPFIYGQQCHPFTLSQLNYYSYPKVNNTRYKQFSIKKKSGKERIINAPKPGLKAIQKCLNLIFQTISKIHEQAFGFVPEKSIVDNAKLHCGKIYVYNLDLKDFFTSIEAGRVWNRLQYPPFNLNEKEGRKELANIITTLCCHEMEVEQLIDGQWQKTKKWVLPQGAPTSPILTNIICERLDRKLSGLAKYFKVQYSRYADDITFSSQHHVFQKDGAFFNGKDGKPGLNAIIASQFFNINEEKIRLQKQGYKQEVTGLVVNEKTNVPRRYIKQLRLWLYYWERYGLENATNLFLSQYKMDKGHSKKGKPNLENVISGKLDYLKMVKGEQDSTYIKLRERFIHLCSETNPINQILDEWEKEGIDKAIESYCKSNIYF